jgi:predicted NAD/FAD-binding protein
VTRTAATELSLKIGIVGAGIAGLVSAWVLVGDDEVTLHPLREE